MFIRRVMVRHAFEGARSGQRASVFEGLWRLIGIQFKIGLVLRFSRSSPSRCSILVQLADLPR